MSIEDLLSTDGCYGGTAPALDLARVEAAALLDVAYAWHDTPVGRLLLAATPGGLVRIAFPRGIDNDPALAELAASVSPRVLHAPARLDGPRRELDAYFEGRLHSFATALDWQLTSGFTRRVLEATTRIPYGETSTYAHVATEAGSPGAHRAAGNALNANPFPIVVPCHRVLRTGGALGGYGGGVDRKRLLLGIESGDAPGD
jgi:methylated-DNA-[protein]-cysteine S-methyltransferase